MSQNDQNSKIKKLDFSKTTSITKPSAKQIVRAPIKAKEQKIQNKE